jgi:cysteinyl-tRNA synthetase
MAIRHLGERLDIHCGGVDHIPVHHTNEIAQAECALGHKWCNWWLHGAWLVTSAAGGEAEKMAKSAGEFLTLQTLIDRGYEPPAYRYFLLQAHYRQQLAFTWEALDAAASAFRSLKRAVLELRGGATGDAQPFEIRLQPFREAVEDDLNMPRALAAMWSVVKAEDAPPAERYATLLEMDKVLGLGFAEMREEQLGLDEGEIERLIVERGEARRAKDFARADRLREQLRAAGVEIMDTPQGTTWRRA